MVNSKGLIFSLLPWAAQLRPSEPPYQTFSIYHPFKEPIHSRTNENYQLTIIDLNSQNIGYEIFQFGNM
jgi:hypothetical protein